MSSLAYNVKELIGVKQHFILTKLSTGEACQHGRGVTGRSAIQWLAFLFPNSYCGFDTRCVVICMLILRRDKTRSLAYPLHTQILSNCSSVMW